MHIDHSSSAFKMEEASAEKSKNIPRIIPNVIDMKSDLHRLRMIFVKCKTSHEGYSSIERLKERYQSIFEKSLQQTRRQSVWSSLRSCEVDDIALEIIRSDSLDEHLKCGTSFRPIR